MVDTVALNTYEFAAARAHEIAVMEEVLRLGNADRAKRVFQRLPRHMRRRQMSHNVKRLPRNMREQARKEMENQGLTKTDGVPKRPSRFSRRRPARLAEAYLRRQKRVRWLETHIWHAKRFHMTEKWGYRLPDRPTDKGIRAAHRYISRYSTIADLSYLQHLEIVGTVDDVVLLFSDLTCAADGATIGAGRYTCGALRGDLMLYAKGQWPLGVIGKAEFLWNHPPQSPSSPPLRQLWLFVHPLAFDEAKAALTLANANAGFRCRLLDLTGEVVRFRLSGPLSLRIARLVLRFSILDETTPAHLDRVAHLEEKRAAWFADDTAAEDVEESRRRESRKRRWDEISSAVPGELPDNLVFGLTVEDPRLRRPRKRRLVGKDRLEDEDVSSSRNVVIGYDPETSGSALWRPEIRRQVRDKRLTIADLHAIRRRALVPGEELRVGKYTSHLPVVVCQNPGGGLGGDGVWGAGIDVFVPSGWGRDFWLSFVLNGARAGGLRETDAVDCEKGIALYPTLFPDSAGGRSSDGAKEASAIDAHFARPIAKRVNHLSLGVRFPFRSPWHILLTEWSGEEVGVEGYFVLRDEGTLKSLAASLLGVETALPTDDSGHLSKSLVPVEVVSDSKGNILPFSLLCLPSVDDVAQSLRRNSTPPVEPVHRVTHDLKKHVRAAVKMGAREADGAARFPTGDAVKDICSRPTMGFTTTGSLSLTLAKPRGVGFVAYDALAALRRNFKKGRGPLFLFSRCPNSLQYRRVRIRVLTPRR